MSVGKKQENCDWIVYEAAEQPELREREMQSLRVEIEAMENAVAECLSRRDADILRREISLKNGWLKWYESHAKGLNPQIPNQFDYFPEIED